MGLPWIKVAADLPDHPKLDLFEEALGLWERCGRGVVIGLWCWTARLYPDGRIPKISWRSMTRNAVAEPPGADGQPLRVTAKQFVEALVKAKLGVVRGDFLVLHDWDEFNSAHARKAEANREAVRRFREKVAREEAQNEEAPKEPGNAPGNAECNAPGKVGGNGSDLTESSYETALDEMREEEKREDKKDLSALVGDQPRPLPEGFHHEPWDPAVLLAIREALKLDDLDNGWGQFVGQSLWEPAEKRHAAAREFLHRRCAANGKDWPYLLQMIRNGAGLKTQPSRSVEAQAQTPAEIAKVRAELAEIRRQGMAPRTTRP